MSRLLIVDDEKDTRKVLGQMLRAAGYEVVEAGEVDAAMDICQSSTIDLIIADILMPGKSGLELIRDIQQLFPAMKIVAISGGFDYGIRSSLPLADTLGVQCTLAKPFSVEDLLGAVKTTLAS